MDPDQRAKVIQSMLSKSGLYVGIGPLTQDHLARVARFLDTQGLFKESENKSARQQHTIKSLLRSWCKRNLQMEDKDWDNLNIANILVTDNSDIIVIQCKATEDATKLTSRAKFLPRDSGLDTPRIVMYIDRRAAKHHKAIANIAKTIREHSHGTVQTNIRTGKNDFLLRKREKGDLTPWHEIPPVVIKQQIPDFEIGTYWDVVNPEEPMEEQIYDKQDPLDIEDIAEVIEDLKTQSNKRDRTTDSEEPSIREKTRKKPSHTL